MQQELQEKLSAEEVELVNNYDKLLGNYMQDIGTSMCSLIVAGKLSLWADHEKTDEDIGMDMEPPRSTKITVRVLVDYGTSLLNGFRFGILVLKHGDLNYRRRNRHHGREHQFGAKLRALCSTFRRSTSHSSGI